MRTLRFVIATGMLALGGRLVAATIAVNASTTTVTIPYTTFGVNMETWDGGSGGSDAAYLAAMKASGIRNVRWPGGSGADTYNWDDLTCAQSYWVTTPQFVTFLNEFGGSMDNVVNFSGNWCGTQYTHAQA
ncbi:MAG: hypothetical protein ACREKE_03920, partial [bacterium]